MERPSFYTVFYIHFWVNGLRRRIKAVFRRFIAVSGRLRHRFLRPGQAKKQYIFLRYIYLVSLLFSRNNFLFLFFSSEIWNGPLLIEPFFNKVLTEEEEKQEKEKEDFL